MKEGPLEHLDNTGRRVAELLLSTERDGIQSLLDYMITHKFFTQPASTRYHLSVPGGLAKHSLGVFERLVVFDPITVQGRAGHGAITLPISDNSVIIAALLHDICKMGAYIGEHTPYKWNRAQPKGHALLSLIRIAEYITMEPIEEMMITYHMGTYGTFEFDSYCSEFPIRGDKSKSKEDRYGKSLANAWYHNPIVKLMYLCDEMDNMAG